jgi:hypothetical protein
VHLNSDLLIIIGERVVEAGGELERQVQIGAPLEEFGELLG